MNEESKSCSNVKTWIFGMLTGMGIAAPITAFFVRKIYDKKKPEESSREPKMGLLEPPRGISDEYTPPEEDINDYNLDIPDEEATKCSEIPVEDQERLADMIEKYNGSLADIPFVINQEQFCTDLTNEKAFVNWYDVDNKFEEDLIVTQDPLTSFGVANGADLFTSDAEKKSGDPDIVYVRNNAQATDYEITRVHNSYKNIVEGTSGIGQANSDM